MTRDPSFNRSYKNPYRRGLLAVAGVTGLFLLIALASTGLTLGGWEDLFIVPAIISGGLTLLFGLIGLGTWLYGFWQVHKIKEFLTSGRPLVQWTYTPEEWQELKEANWQEEQGDWQLQLGCLTVIFALAGLLTGAMIGGDEGLAEAFTGGLIGGGIGALLGGLIGAVVAGFNHLAVRQAYQQIEPGEVALAPDELYVNEDYFKGNGDSSYIKHTELQPGTPTLLQITVRVPLRPRGPSEETWVVVVPPRMIERVKAILPSLQSYHEEDKQDD